MLKNDTYFTHNLINHLGVFSQITQYRGLEYITVVGVSLRPEIDLCGKYEFKIGRLDFVVANAVLSMPIAIRGAELQFLRKAMGLSQEQLAADLQLRSSTICRWEKRRAQRLELVCEIAVRFYFMEKLKLRVKLKLSQIRKYGTPSEVILINARDRLKNWEVTQK